MKKTHAVAVSLPIRHVADASLMTPSFLHTVVQCPPAVLVHHSAHPSAQSAPQVTHHWLSALASTIWDSTKTTRTSRAWDTLVVVHSLTNTSHADLVLSNARCAAVKLQHSVEVSNTGLDSLLYQHSSDIMDYRRDQQCLHQTDSPSSIQTGSAQNDPIYAEVVKWSFWRCLRLHCPTMLSNKFQ